MVESENETDECTEVVALPPHGNHSESDKIVRNHVLWSMGAGLIPIPIFDIAAVTAIQVAALEKLAEAEGVDFSKDVGKKFLAALTGGTVARLAASLVKTLPGVGTIVGGLSMSAFSAASTYAVCQVALHYFRGGGNFLEVDLEGAKKMYESAIEKGKQFVKTLEREVDPEETRAAYKNLEKLKDLCAAGVISEEEFEQKKEKLLEGL
jgi:uncharacterized protein (DUF697 family)